LTTGALIRRTFEKTLKQEGGGRTQSRDSAKSRGFLDGTKKAGKKRISFFKRKA